MKGFSIGFSITIGPNPLHNGSVCAHDYRITRYVMPHPKGYHIVMGDDNRFHVVNESCLPPNMRWVPEISP
jgi:hypothetical protein